MEVYYSKEIVQDLSSVFGIAEVIGLAVAAAVLLAMLGTLVAAGLPLLMAVLGVGAGVGGTLALSSVIEMASITPALALMLGLAVGIDYSLFIVHRHRRQLLEGMAAGGIDRPRHRHQRQRRRLRRPDRGDRPGRAGRPGPAVPGRARATRPRSPWRCPCSSPSR